MLEVCAPARPLAPYKGGKRLLSKRLVERIGQVPHELYAEPFVGMGGVFLRRTLRPKAEVINDISQDVTTLFRVLQRHYQAFLDMLKWQLASRAEWDRLMAVDPATLTDLERAARFLYLQRLGFGGNVRARTFGVVYDEPSRFDLTKLVPMLEDVHERLCGVVIERLPFMQFIERYDRPGTLFYLDPPYWGCEQDYGPVFGREDFARLADRLAMIKGRFVLSINDRPEIREIFGRFEIEAVGLTYSVGPGVTEARELIISK
jgi:DNA adenine methylase